MTAIEAPTGLPTTDPRERFDVRGRSVLITGASGALGSAAARSLAAGGARLTLAGGNVEALATLRDDVVAAGGSAVVVPLRPDTDDDAGEMVSAAVTAFGSLDGVLVASGLNRVAPIVEMTVETFDEVMDGNVRGAWLVARAAGMQLIAQGTGGSVVLVSSTRGRLGHPAGYSAYCPSKAATDLLARTLAAEWGRHGIRVNAIAPTVFRSDLTAWMYGEDEKGRATREAMLARIPLGRLAETDDLVGPLLFLLSDASSFCTGQILYVDGGYTAC